MTSIKPHGLTREQYSKRLQELGLSLVGLRIPGVEFEDWPQPEDLHSFLSEINTMIDQDCADQGAPQRVFC